MLHAHPGCMRNRKSKTVPPLLSMGPAGGPAPGSAKAVGSVRHSGEARSSGSARGKTPTRASGRSKSPPEAVKRNSTHGKGKAAASKEKRKSNPNPLAGAHIDVESEVPVRDQIREIVAHNAVKIVDLFRSWDRDEGTDLNWVHTAFFL